jgi:prepilin-type N-terminal cleavage/methylation domain-containing protein
MERSMTSVHSSRGFSLIESMIAVSILAGGLLAIAVVFLQGSVQLKGSEFDVLAREKAAEAIESVFAARDSRTIPWDDIRNEDAVDDNPGGGVFKNGALSLTRPGADGLVNTEDDDPLVLESLVQPGVDGRLGTEDDVIQPLTQFTREVVIRDVTQSLRELQVIIRYDIGGEIREYVISTLISSYA